MSVARVAAASFLAGSILVAACVALANRLDPFAEQYEWYERRIGLGMSEAQVRDNLGEPQKVYLAGSAPKYYYVSGYSYRERPISSKVLIYVSGEPICYVWLNEDGNVEDYFVGGS